MKRLTVATVALFGFTTLLSAAESLSFEDVWQTISQHSYMQKGADLRVQSAKSALSRASYPWRSRVYGDARAYQTNDPGDSFFGLLEQRDVKSQDFDPSRLNHPSEGPFIRGAVGVDLALYEGGEKEAKQQMYRHIVSQETWTKDQVRTEQYAQVFNAYGAILIVQMQQKKLNALKDQLVGLMRNYQLGQKSNPVGYSGLLGMKSLLNRIEAELEQLTAQRTSSYVMLHEMGVQYESWIPKPYTINELVTHFAPYDANDLTKKSYNVLAKEAQVQVGFKAAELEKTRFKPRSSAFVETTVFNGSRNTALSYRAGAYVQWLIHDPADKDAYKEMEMSAKALENYNQALEQSETAQRKHYVHMETALKANLERLDQSDALLSEQLQVSQTLFKNGSISALQFVEILNRRMDLIAEQTNAELSLVKMASMRLTSTQLKGGNL